MGCKQISSIRSNSNVGLKDDKKRKRRNGRSKSEEKWIYLRGGEEGEERAREGDGDGFPAQEP